MPRSRDSYRPVAGSLDGWTIQRNVISALVYRELKTRVSQVKFGILGVFLEPLGVIAVFLLLFGVLRGGRPVNGLDLLLFLTSGVLLYTMFMDIALRSLKAMDANEALFFYRPVKPVDTVIARALVESGLYGIVYLVLIAAIFFGEGAVDSSGFCCAGDQLCGLSVNGLWCGFVAHGGRPSFSGLASADAPADASLVVCVGHLFLSLYGAALALALVELESNCPGD